MPLTPSEDFYGVLFLGKFLRTQVGNPSVGTIH